MLSLAKLGRGREDYYLRAVGADATEYYSERGEVAGRWLGGGAEALGLAGRVHDQQLLALLAGYEPAAVLGEQGWEGERLVAPPSAGKRMPGLDACYMAPKSVSLLWAFGDEVKVGDRTLDKVIEDAHDEAVRESLGYLEAEAAKGRRGRDGVRQIDTSGYVAAAFRHRSSRSDDPHLHTHVVLVNACQGSDGRWGALDARLSYVYAKAAGYLYAAHLRHVLDRELGVEWRRVENGLADVARVPEEMIALFSKRSQELHGALEEVTRRLNEERMKLGLRPIEAESGAALDIAANQTRGAKLYNVATDDLRAGWRQKAADAGHDVGQLAAALHRGGEPPGPADEAERHRRVAAGMTENASTFGERDAIQGLAADAGQGAPVEEVLRRATELLASDEVVAVAAPAPAARTSSNARMASSLRCRLMRPAGRRRTC